MTGEQNWRTEVNAEDYFSHQKKTVAVADRRPVIRKTSDLVGPGIADAAISITDFNNLLATYNGFYSAEIGTFGAPNDTEKFVGTTVMDDTMGGTQTFTGMTTGDVYQRVFTRNPSDPNSLFWGEWKTPGGPPVGSIYVWPTATPPRDHLICNGSTFSGVLYPALLSLLGTTTLPDLRDRAVYGVGDEWSLGETDGLPYGSRISVHDHGFTGDPAGLHSHIVGVDAAGNHTHTVSPASLTVQSNTAATGGSDRLSGPASHDHGGATGTDGSHSHVGAAASSGTHSHSGDVASAQVFPPGIGLNWIIRAK